MQSMDKRADHSMSVAFQSVKGSDEAKELVSDAAGALHDRRTQEGNIFADLLQGSGDTDSNSFVWIEEWSTQGEHGKITTQDAKIEEHLFGPLLDLAPIEETDGNLDR